MSESRFSISSFILIDQVNVGCKQQLKSRGLLMASTSNRTRFDDPDRLRIAIAGRANAGKTTLVRTLLRSPVGEVADRANVTKWPEYYIDDALGVVFIDCPGFQDAGAYRAYRLLRERSPEAAEDLRDGADFSYEERAMEAIGKCDLTIYVGSLEAVPTESHKQELRLLRDCAHIIGILNKRWHTRRAGGEEATRERVGQWSEIFHNAGVPWMDYDAHVAPPAALNKLYDLLASHVPVERAERVQAYVSAREQRIRDQREQVTQYFAREVIELRRSEVVASVPRENYTKERGKQVALEALRNEVGGRLIRYVDFCAKAYGFGHAFKQPMLNISPDIEQNFLEGGVGSAIFMAIFAGNAGATLGGSGGLAVGAVIGFIIAGPAGAWVGSDVGMKLGLAIGGFTGVFGGGRWGFKGDKEATVKVKASEYLLQAYSDLAVAWATALAYQGFGKGEIVDIESMTELKDQVKIAIKGASPIELMSSTEEQISRWMENILRELHS
jgi:hypothetical protein